MKLTTDVLTAEGHAADKGLERLLSRLAQEGRALTNVFLFFTAPFVGLVYIIAFPFVGFAALSGSLARAAHARRS